LKTYAPRPIFDVEVVDLDSIMLPRAAWKRIETHFDVRKDFFHGSGSCLCTHVSCVVGLNLTALCFQFRAKSTVAGAAEPRARGRLSSVLNNRICGAGEWHAIRINVHRKTSLSPFDQEYRLVHSDQIPNLASHRDLNGNGRPLKCWQNPSTPQ
jgi:hypothetical protein